MIKQIPYYDIIEKPEWSTVSSAPASHASGANLAGDYRAGLDGDPNLYFTSAAGAMAKYNTFTDGFIPMQSPQLSGWGAGSDSVFHPSVGPRGLIAAGATPNTFQIGTTVTCTVTNNSLNISTTGNAFAGLFTGLEVLGPGIPAGTIIQTVTNPNNIVLNNVYTGVPTSVALSFGVLPAPVMTNQLANRGDDVGFKIRVIDSAAGGTGKIRERFIIANTAGNAPTVTLGDAKGNAVALDFTPSQGSMFELLSGRLYMLGTFPTVGITVPAVVNPGNTTGTFFSVASCLGITGSPTLISTAGSFTAANGLATGQMIVGPGIPLYTYILSINSANSITMSQNFQGLPQGYTQGSAFPVTFWIQGIYTTPATGSRAAAAVTINTSFTHQITTGQIITVLNSSNTTEIPLGCYTLTSGSGTTFGFNTVSSGALSNVSITYMIGGAPGAMVCTTNNNANITSSALFGAVGTGVLPGMSVQGAGVPWGTTVLSKADASTITLSGPISSTGSNLLIFGMNTVTGNPGAGTFVNVKVGDAVSGTGILPGSYVTSLTNYPATPSSAGAVNTQMLMLNQPIAAASATTLTFNFANSTGVSSVVPTLIGSPYVTIGTALTGLAAGQTFTHPLFPAGTKVLKVLSTTSFIATSNCAPFGIITLIGMSKAGSTTTITTPFAHGLANGATIHITVSSNAAALPLGSYVITLLTANSFSITTNATAVALTDTATMAIPYILGATFNKVTATTNALFNIPNHGLQTGTGVTCSLTSTTSFVLGTAYSVTVLDANNILIVGAAGGGETTGTASFYLGATNTQIGRFQGGNFNSYSQAANEIVIRNNPCVSTGLASIATDGHMLSLSELHVPYNRKPGEGLIGGTSTYDTGTEQTKTCHQATAATANTLTGQPAGGDSVLVANEYRNFQIRIVEDTTNVTAVGQRMRIASHTGGASPVFTFYSNFAVTPSSSAKYLIENDDDKILYFAAGYPQVFTYSISNDSWDASTWAWRGTPQLLSIPVTASSNFYDLSTGNTSSLAVGNVFYGPTIGNNSTYITDITSSTRFTLTSAVAIATNNVLWYSLPNCAAGMMTNQPFGLARNTQSKHSVITCFRGMNTPILDTFDIAAGATGTWSINVPYGNEGQITNSAVSTFVGESFSTGSCLTYACATHQGRFAYININNTLRFYKWDCLSFKLIPFEYGKIAVGTAAVGSRLEVQSAQDPTNSSLIITTLYCIWASSSTVQSLILK